MSPGWRMGKRRFEAGTDAARPDWQQASPGSIAKALRWALAQPTGNWFALDAERRIDARPCTYEVAGTRVVTWRDSEGIHVAPEACPHMGASLDGARISDGKLLCPWHGLELGCEGHGAWSHLPIHQDGVLLWVRIGPEDPEVPLPRLPVRPQVFIDGVIRIEAACAPEDVIANRLDPWHGGHFHPYSFGALEVLSESEEALTVRVEKLVLGRLRVEVDATFHCPDARTIVMTIIDGEGKGSVVETHATPMRNGRTAVIEATLASSQRPGFQHAQKLSGLIRPFIERSARRLWVDDAAYAERLYALRQDQA